MTGPSLKLARSAAADLLALAVARDPARAQTVSFIARRDFAVGAHPQSVAVGDVNADGKMDVVVANAGSNTVSVLLGNGDSTFVTLAPIAVGTTPQSIAVGD